MVYINSQAVAETPGQYPGAGAKTGRLIAAFAGTLCKAKPPARNERGRTKQVYNHYPYPLDRTHVRFFICEFSVKPLDFYAVLCYNGSDGLFKVNLG